MKILQFLKCDDFRAQWRFCRNGTSSSGEHDERKFSNFLIMKQAPQVAPNAGVTYLDPVELMIPPIKFVP